MSNNRTQRMRHLISLISGCVLTGAALTACTPEDDEPFEVEDIAVINTARLPVLFCYDFSKTATELEVGEVLYSYDIYRNWIAAGDTLRIPVTSQPFLSGMAAITFSREVMEQYTREEIIDRDLFLDRYYFSFDELLADGFTVTIGGGSH